MSLPNQLSNCCTKINQRNNYSTIIKISVNISLPLKDATLVFSKAVSRLNHIVKGLHYSVFFPLKSLVTS